MKLRNVVVVVSAALIGVTSSFAQAGPRDGYRGDRHYSGDRHGGHYGHQRSHRGGSNDLAIAALGIGLIGALIASQANSQPYVQHYARPYGYAPGYNSNYGYQYNQPGYYGYTQPGQ